MTTTTPKRKKAGTSLAAFKARCAALTDQIAELKQEAIDSKAKFEKELAAAKQSNEYLSKAHNEKSNEIDACHAFLDALPNPIEKDAENPSGYGKLKHSLTARMAAWLVSRQPQQIHINNN